MVNQDLSDLVKQARELVEEERFREAKSVFTDAAQLALKLSKTSDKSSSYEEICRALISEAKEMQRLLQAQNLPAVPEYKFKSKVARFSPPAPQKKLQAFHIWIIKEGGIPLVSHSFDAEKSEHVNPVLFSGAITAINSLMLEAIEKRISSITFEENVLIIHTSKNVSYVLFANEEDERLQEFLIDFCNNIEKELGDLSSRKYAYDISNDERVKKILKKSFPDLA